MSRAILFATTLSPHDASLGDVAARWAQRAGVGLRLVHVCEDARAPAVLGTDEEPLLGDVRARLEAEAARLRALTGGVVQPHLAAGAPVAALIAISTFEQADLILVGDARVRSRLLGTTAERASHDASTPVLVLRSAGRLRAWLEGTRRLKVLVGIDAGLAADAARAWAEGLSRLGPCDVELVHVCAPDEVHERLRLPPPRDEHALSDEARGALERELDRRRPSPPGWTRTIVAARGSADAHLVAHADRTDADLVVVGQRKASWLDRLWTGSVGHGVLRSCPVSVATIPVSMAGSTSAVRPPRVVVVGTDFSATSMRALQQALLMTPPDATVHLVHVLPPVANAADLVTARADAWRRLQEQPGAAPQALTVQHHLLEGDVADEVLALARRCGADLIVLGTSQRGLGAVPGPVARAVTNRTTVPLLLVPAASP